MIVAIPAVIAGLICLIWSADRFVAGSAAAARLLRVPSLLIGMLVVGFGTSMPEMLVSILAAMQGNPGIALGNAYGSNVFNISLILGITALVASIQVQSAVLKRELPILLGATGLAFLQIRDGTISRAEAMVLLAVFGLVTAWSIRQGMRENTDPWIRETEQELRRSPMSMRRAVLWITVGLVGLIAGSRILVLGAVEIAQTLGISDLVIGLTIVAAGTSLPELASSIAAARKGEHSIILGNIIGSNLLNTLAVVGVSAAISPMAVASSVIARDFPVMAGFTLCLFLVAHGFGKPGRIRRAEGGILVGCYGAYLLFLLR